ncbi:MAG: hypothetical protein QM762_23315 [Chryseolinea sp.]
MQSSLRLKDDMHFAKIPVLQSQLMETIGRGIGMKRGAWLYSSWEDQTLGFAIEKSAGPVVIR